MKPLQFTEHKLVGGDYYFDRQCSKSGGALCGIVFFSQMICPSKWTEGFARLSSL